MGFIDWFFNPITDFIEDVKIGLQTNQQVIIEKEEGFTLPSFSRETKLFRPQTFDQYIGQQRAKDILKMRIKFDLENGTKTPHILIHGFPGSGKTTLARIIANEMKVNFQEVVTSTLQSPADLSQAIYKVDGGILFADEVHSLKREMAESIYSVMEDFKYNGNPIKPFTLIGATTELGEMLADRRPFVDRFKIIIELEDYTMPELSALIEQYRLSTLNTDHISSPSYEIIARNCRGTPRTALRLLDALIYMKDLDKVLKSFGIIKDGFTEKDLKTLKHISQNEKGVGLQGLSAYLGTSAKNYLYEIEPYLVKNNLIIRAPRGRKINEIGELKIKELERNV